MRIFIFFFMAITIFGKGMATSNQGEDIGPSETSEVHIGPNGISMPFGKILVVRKGTDYCALKFTKFWTGTGENKEDQYASYECYFQNDKSGDFSKNNVKLKKEELYFPKARWSIFGHPVAFGTKDEIHCGFAKLWWSGKGTVYFFERGQSQADYGIEFAPTKWTHISQVNVFDPRLKWLRYDEYRKRVNIHVDKLWEDK